MSEGRDVFAVRDLLDLPIIDAEGRAVGRVDDVEINDRGRGRPTVAALLVGGMAFSDRFGGLFRRWFRALYARFHDEKHPHADRIAWTKVRHINSRVDLKVTTAATGIGRLERWAEKIVARIPGADHAPSE